MSQGFVNLENLIPGERYSFNSNFFQNAIVEGTLVVVIFK